MFTWGFLQQEHVRRPPAQGRRSADRPLPPPHPILPRIHTWPSLPPDSTLATRLPLESSHSARPPLSDPVTRPRPSGVTASAVTGVTWPGISSRGVRPWLRSHTCEAMRAAG
eukprot:350643-Chlamydomonas_euryale.AAC.3